MQSPYGQPQPYQAQFQGQPQPAMQGQAAPVPGVPFPSTPYGPAQGQGQPGPQGQAQPQGPARQLVELARTLEQLIPGYQALEAILFELSASSGGRPAIAGISEAVRGLKSCLYFHGATLGTIRRMLVGETSPTVLIALAAAFQLLAQEHGRARPMVEQALGAMPPAMLGPLSPILQNVGTVDGLLQKAGAAIQALVGPQAWEAGRERASAEPTAAWGES